MALMFVKLHAANEVVEAWLQLQELVLTVNNGTDYMAVRIEMEHFGNGWIRAIYAGSEYATELLSSFVDTSMEEMYAAITEAHTTLKHRYSYALESK